MLVVAPFTGQQLMKLFAISVFFLVTVLSPGCSDTKGGMLATLGGIEVEVVGHTAGQTSMIQSNGKEYTLTLGDVKVRIEGQRLSVNQQHYGVVKQGDVVKVREDGTIVVNGQEREPQPD